MAILVQRTYKKEKSDSLFYRDKTGTLKKYKNQFKDAGKLLSEDVKYTNDNLHLTYTALWVSKEAYDEYLSIKELQDVWALKRAYNKENSIISTKTVSEV